MGALVKLEQNVKVEDFRTAKQKVDTQINALQTVIDKYEAKRNSLDSFVGKTDSSYEQWVAAIDENVKAARKAKAALIATSKSLETTISNMENMSTNIIETISEAGKTVGAVVTTAMKVDALL